MNKISKLPIRSKVLILVVIVVVIVLAIFGITKQGHKATAQQSVSKVTTTGNKSQTIRLSDALKAKQTSIWYDFNLSSGEMLKRDTIVRNVYVIKNGYITPYYTNTDEALKVSDINKLSDSEIISKAKKLNKEYEEGLVNDVKKRIKNKTYFYVDSVTDAQKATSLASLNAIKYEAPKPQKIKIEATNNGQNKTPISESITFSQKWLFNDGKVYDMEGNKTSHDKATEVLNEKYVMKGNPDTISVSGQSQYNAEIDGQKYNGFANELMTKVKSANIIFALDTEKGSLISKNTGSDE
ncbi:hypothetical protein [Leuconostoc mesenteroides]|uniref:hypothetical protein n=1 Tax=Leuconostoc mesenteroides TaxID=1245 RepID=UPI002360CBFE|nr:hypothetical protein [Leuconostoc mesenteroides]